MAEIPESLAPLRADVIARWRQAFSRFAEAQVEAAGNLRTVFTEIPAFSLSDYTPKKFKPGARLSDQPVSDRGCRFELDELRRPVRVSFSHPVSGSAWRGCYRYSPEEVEYLEFCLQTRVPAIYHRLRLEAGLVVEEQCFRCNSRGTRWLAAPGAGPGAAEAILSHPANFFLTVLRFEIRYGRTHAAQEYHESAGHLAAPTRSYAYSPEGRLLRIVQHWPTGPHTIFAAKTKATTRQLSERLSEALAKSILLRLTDASPRSPLRVLELSYHRFDAIVPMLIPVFETDPPETIFAAVQLRSERWLQLGREEFEPEMTEFCQRALEAEKYGEITKMLRTAARLVTERAPSFFKVAEGFVAFPIDWEIEGDGLQKILRKCGASPAKLKEWRGLGLL